MSKLYILFGSATGNAEGIAKDLAEKQLPNHFSSVVCQPMDSFKKLASEWSLPPVSGRKHAIVFICSTTGNGDPPENASRFFRYIKRKQTVELQPFEHCTFSVLGLGDTNYDQFCAMGKIVDRKMVELGAERAKPLACADEATGLEDVVEPWVETVFDDILIASRIRAQSEDPNRVKKDQETSAESSEFADPPPLKSEFPLFIMYGSATGNAEQIAKDLAASYELILKNPDVETFFSSVVCDELDTFKKKCLPVWEQRPANGTKHGLIVVTSTTGNGDPPENCSRFWRFMKRKQTIETQPFEHVAYAILALGDTNYDQFCATGKGMDRKMSELGGIRAMSLVCADEATGLEDTVEPWSASVLANVTICCSGAGPTTMAMSDKASPMDIESNEEEKKTESTEDAVKTTSPCQSSGVKIVRGLLEIDDSSILPTVDNTLLPSLGASRSSCELFKEDPVDSHTRNQKFDDRATISSASSGAMNYTFERPHNAKILSSRYLTKTSTEGARLIMDNLNSDGVQPECDIAVAQSILDASFPLDGPSQEENAKNGKRVLEISMALPDDFSLEYQPGDALGLVASNDQSNTAFVLDIMKETHGILPSQMVSIDSNEPITVESAIREKVDLTCTLKSKRILNGLLQFATNSEEAAAIRLLCSKDRRGDELFEKFVVNQRRSFVDILKDFPSCQSITLEGILSLLPTLPPRYYSVSSSPLESGKEMTLSIAFSVVDFLTPSMIVAGEEIGCRRIHGLATGYLEAVCSPLLAVQSVRVQSPVLLKIFPKPATDFRLPPSLSTPMILVGPGTGISPFIGFLAHRRALRSSNKLKDAACAVVEGTWRGGYELEAEDVPVGDNDSNGLFFGAGSHQRDTVGAVELYFGCRYSEHDWLYEEEMKSFLKDDIISNLHTAFSRDQKSQVYVQDLMMQQASSERLVELIMKKNAIVYICGDGNRMARDVQKSLVEILGKSAQGANGSQYLETMKQEGRLVLDIWS